MRLSFCHMQVIRFLLYRPYKDYVSPSEIGSTIKGKGYHSNWASPKCLVLTKLGILERSDKGHYRLKYLYRQLLSNNISVNVTERSSEFKKEVKQIDDRLHKVIDELYVCQQLLDDLVSKKRK